MEFFIRLPMSEMGNIIACLPTNVFPKNLYSDWHVDCGIRKLVLATGQTKL